MAIFFYQLQGLNFEFKKKLETWSAFLKYIMGNERNLSTLVVEYQYLRFLVRTYHCWILKEVTTYKSSTQMVVNPCPLTMFMCRAVKDITREIHLFRRMVLAFKMQENNERNGVANNLNREKGKHNQYVSSPFQQWQSLRKYFERVKIFK